MKTVFHLFNFEEDSLRETEKNEKKKEKELKEKTQHATIHVLAKLSQELDHIG